MIRLPYTIAKCEHYRGSALVCRKDISPFDVADDEGRTPCVSIRGITGKVACDQRVMPSEPPAGEPGPATKMLNAMLDGKCPTCESEIAGEMEFNGAILALPCRHVIKPAPRGRREP